MALMLGQQSLNCLICMFQDSKNITGTAKFSKFSINKGSTFHLKDFKIFIVINTSGLNREEEAFS